jgi:hypothetical protein
MAMIPLPQLVYSSYGLFAKADSVQTFDHGSSCLEIATHEATRRERCQK